MYYWYDLSYFLQKKTNDLNLDLNYGLSKVCSKCVEHMNICILWYIHAEIINLYILQSHQWIAAEYWYTVTAQQINNPVTYWMSEYWEKLINHACLPDRILYDNDTRLGWNILIFAFQTVNKHVLENSHKKHCILYSYNQFHSS